MVNGGSKFGNSWLPDSLNQDESTSEPVEASTAIHQRFQFKRQITMNDSDDYDDDTTLFSDIESQTRTTLFDGIESDDIESQTRSRYHNDSDSSACSDEASTTVCAPSRTTLPQDSKVEFDEEAVKALRTQIMEILEDRNMSNERNAGEKEDYNGRNMKAPDDNIDESKESNERNQSTRINNNERKRIETREKIIEKEKSRIRARPASRNQTLQPTQLEIKQNTGDSRQKCLKTTLICLGVYCLVVSGLGGLLMQQLFQIPGKGYVCTSMYIQHFLCKSWLMQYHI